MMLKDYFTDGLVQVAIVLSLLRSDLDGYFDVAHVTSSIHTHHRLPHLQEARLGPLSGFTSTDLIIGDRVGYPAVFRKSIDNDNYLFSSVLSDLHSLSDYRRLDGIATNIATWLVSDAGAARPVPADRPPQTSPHPHDHEVSGAAGSNTSSPEVNSTGSALSVVSDTDSEESELSKEDMEIINILYLQDIDLGVSRDVFDIGFCPEDDLEFLKSEQTLLPAEEKSATRSSAPASSGREQLRMNEFQQLSLSGRYVIDTETGELILVPSPTVTTLTDVAIEPPVTAVTQTEQAFSVSGNVLDARGSLPADSYFLPDEDVSYIEPDLFDADQTSMYGGETQTSQSHITYQRQSSLDLRWADVLSVIESPPSVESNAARASASWEVLGDLHAGPGPASTGGLVQNVSMSSVAGLASNDSFPLHHAAAELPFFPPTIFPFNALDNESLSFHAPFSPAFTYTNSLMDLVGAASLSNVDFSSHPDSAAIDVLSTADDFGESDFLGFPTSYFPDLTTRGPQTSGGFGDQALNETEASSEAVAAMAMDVDQLTISIPDEVTAVVATQVADTNELFQQLLYGDLLLDDLDMDDVMEEGDISSYQLNAALSTDSAVSSMSSPGQLSSTGSTASAAVDMPEGASGGTDDDDQKYEAYDLKYEAAYNCDDTFPSFSSYRPPHRANSSANSTDIYRRPTDTLKTIRHNHTYPLAPGQRSRAQVEEDARREREEHAVRSRDEKRAKAMKIPLTMEEIIDSSVEHFTHLLSRLDLNDAQLQLVRDIRRRGKNKLAAQNCRKRKMEVIQTVEEQVTALRRQRDQLRKERANLDRGTAALKDKLARLEHDLFRQLRNESGREYDPAAFSLLQTDDGGLFIVPRDATAERRDEKPERKRKPKKKD